MRSYRPVAGTVINLWVQNLWFSFVLQTRTQSLFWCCDTGNYVYHIDWITGWRNVLFTGNLIERLTLWLMDNLKYWLQALIDWLFEWRIGWVLTTKSMTNCISDWIVEWLAERLTDTADWLWLTLCDWLPEWVFEYLRGYLNDCLSVSVLDLTSWFTGCLCVWVTLCE